MNTFEQNFRLLNAHIKIKFLNLFRQPTYIIGTLVFPGLFFLFFAAPNATTVESANLLLGSFASFSVVGVALFQFGIDFSQERESAWSTYLFTLPAPPLIFMLARSMVCISVALLAAISACVIVSLSSPAHLSASQWLQLISTLMLTVIPIAVFSLGLSTLFSGTAAVPFFNLIYLTLSYAGGLWIPPSALPKVIQDISQYLPTRAIGELAWGITSGQKFEWRWIGILCVTALIGALIPKLTTAVARSR
jgi:ABC-2 type transport system permease protein